MLRQFVLSSAIVFVSVVGLVDSARSTLSGGNRYQEPYPRRVDPNGGEVINRTVTDPSQCPSGIAVVDPEAGDIKCVDAPIVSQKQCDRVIKTECPKGTVITSPHPLRLEPEQIVATSDDAKSVDEDEPTLVYPGLPPAPSPIPQDAAYRGSGRNTDPKEPQPGELLIGAVCDLRTGEKCPEDRRISI